MAKQQSEHIEDRFREAAENISVPPNPGAWEKMEALLDAHQRRKPIVFWWYLAMVGVLAVSGIIMYYSLQSNSDRLTAAPTTSSSTTSEKSQTSAHPAGAVRLSENADENSHITSNNTVAPGNSAYLRSRKKAEGVTAKTSPKLQQGLVSKNQISNNPVQKLANQQREASEVSVSAESNRSQAALKHRTHANPVALKAGGNSSPLASKAGQHSSATSVTPGSHSAHEALSGLGENEGNEGKEAKTQKGQQVTGASQGAEGGNGVSKNRGEQEKAQESTTDPVGGRTSTKSPSATSTTQKNTTQATTKDSLAEKLTKITSPASKWKLGRGLNFYIASQVDATTLHHYSLHEFKPLFGAGLGYRFSNRFSVQTGFMVQKAIYSADPGDYVIKAGTYLSTFSLMKIDATCLLYEVPLTMRYDFAIAKNFRLFSSAGFESYFLKKEDYKYHLMGAGGYRMLDSTYTTNKNVFASSYLSLGLEQKITPAFSIQVEPYLKVPISGIGEGKVKLYSAGMQLSLKFQPVTKSPGRK